MAAMKAAWQAVAGNLTGDAGAPKDRYKVFCGAVMQLHSALGPCQVPNEDVREELRETLIEALVPPLQAFLHLYSLMLLTFF